jgi:hypothetical protein
MPTVSWRSCSKASLSLVPTPSVPETSTGWRYFSGAAQGAEAADPREHLGTHACAARTA